MIRFRYVLSVFVAALVMAPTSASAGSERVLDRRHDVVRIAWVGSDCDYGGPECHERQTVASKHRLGDVVWSRSAYHSKRLVLTMKVRGMSKRPSPATYVGWDIDSANGEDVSVQILYSSGQVDLLVLGFGADFECPGARAVVAPKRHLYSVTIPSACLERAAWVRVSASTLVQNYRYAWVDVAGVGPEVLIESTVPEPSYGRRIHRGSRT